MLRLKSLAMSLVTIAIYQWIALSPSVNANSENCQNPFEVEDHQKPTEEFTIPDGSKSLQIFNFAQTGNSFVRAVVHTRNPFNSDHFNVNSKLDLYVMPVAGEGKLITPKEEFELSNGKAVLIAAGTPFAFLPINGELVIAAFYLPQFTPEQFSIVDSRGNTVPFD